MRNKQGAEYVTNKVKFRWPIHQIMKLKWGILPLEPCGVGILGKSNAKSIIFVIVVICSCYGHKWEECLVSKVFEAWKVGLQIYDFFRIIIPILYKLIPKPLFSINWLGGY